MLITFPKAFFQAATSQGYFPKGQLPKCGISKAATTKSFRGQINSSIELFLLIFIFLRIFRIHIGGRLLRKNLIIFAFKKKAFTPTKIFIFDASSFPKNLDLYDLKISTQMIDLPPLASRAW